MPYLFLIIPITAMLLLIVRTIVERPAVTKQQEPALTIKGQSTEISFAELKYLCENPRIFNGIRSDAIQLGDTIIHWDGEYERLMLAKGSIDYTGPFVGQAVQVKWDYRKAYWGRGHQCWLEFSFVGETNNLIEVARVYENEHDIVFSKELTPWETAELHRELREKQIKQIMNQ